MTKKPTPKPDPKPDTAESTPASSGASASGSTSGSNPEEFLSWQRNEQRRDYSGVALMGLLARNADPAGIARQAADLGEALAVEVEKRGWLQR